MCIRSEENVKKKNTTKTTKSSGRRRYEAAPDEAMVEDLSKAADQAFRALSRIVNRYNKIAPGYPAIDLEEMVREFNEELSWKRRRAADRFPQL